MALQYPLTAGQKITAEFMNELIAAIQDGSIFTSTSFVSDLITTLDTRVATLENQVSALVPVLEVRAQREQILLTAAQASVTLTKPPTMDSDILSFNGQVLSRTGTPAGFVGDYSISGSLITFNPSFSLQIEDGDILVVSYHYEVTI